MDNKMVTIIHKIEFATILLLFTNLRFEYRVGSFVFLLLE